MLNTTNFAKLLRHQHAILSQNADYYAGPPYGALKQGPSWPTEANSHPFHFYFESLLARDECVSPLR